MVAATQAGTARPVKPVGGETLVRQIVDNATPEALDEVGRKLTEHGVAKLQDIPEDAALTISDIRSILQ